MNCIEIKDLKFGYEDTLVLDNVNMQIEKGDYVGIIGANGTGKSTLIKLILGLLPPKSGMVIRNEKNVGYVPQVGLSVKGDFPATVMEVVMMNLYGSIGFLKRPKKEHYQKAEQALDIVGMLDYKNRLIGKLSGGQQQRVLIAKSLVGSPDILILDEPVTGIDAKSEENLYQLLKRLNRENGITIIMVTHNILEVKNDMNKIYEIRDKNLVLLQDSDMDRPVERTCEKHVTV